MPVHPKVTPNAVLRQEYAFLLGISKPNMTGIPSEERADRLLVAGFRFQSRSSADKMCQVTP